MNDELRATLLDLFPGKAEFVDDFLTHVDDVNEVAMTRIARAVTSTTVEEESTEEEVTEVVEEAIVEENVTETEETDEIVIELDENFVPDLVNSPEFRTALASALESEVNKLRNEFTAQIRSLQSRVDEQDEVIQDVPSRTKRAVVGYRPTGVAENTTVEQNERTYAEIAKNSVSEIFD